MRVEIRNDSVLIEGYVNAVERESRPVLTERGRVIEKIRAGAFKKALERITSIPVLLNHRKDRVLGNIEDGCLELKEDAIGLRARVITSDPEVMQEAKEGKLQGWSFGMYVNEDSYEERAGKLPLRTVSDLDITEVSIIDMKLTPCYVATSIEARAEGEKALENRVLEDEVEINKMSVDYSGYEGRIEKIKSCTGAT